MKIKSKLKYQSIARDWFASLQDNVCEQLEDLEKEFNPKNPAKMVSHKTSQKEGWKQEHRIIKGNVFEKGTVNFSEVSGKFEDDFKKQIPGTDKDPSFWASGISVVLHMKNPKVPAMHFNTRFICTEKCWFGGGMDVTPCIKNDEQKEWYHTELELMCNQHDEEYYSKFSEWCDEYFYLPHRKEPRGIGGLFFDYHFKDFDKDMEFVKDVGKTFVNIMKHIVFLNNTYKYTQEDKEVQLFKRGRYVEFNLMYDRGTKFGLQTGGNMDAILMSLPPEVKW
jgi:coproporphyrinogen III oxidase